jgi:hypothetical protein
LTLEPVAIDPYVAGWGENGALEAIQQALS